MTDLASLTSWNADWAGLRVAVFGLGVTGFAAADTLVELGADVLVVAAHASVQHRELVQVIGARFIQALGDETPGELAAFDAQVVVVSPGFPPDQSWLRWAAGHDIPIWSDIELAWRLRDKVPLSDGLPAEWILITGTSGKTATTRLTATMLAAAGVRAAPCGNIGVPVLDAIRDPGGFDVLVVELSRSQLHWMQVNPGGIVAPFAAVCLNLGAGDDRDARAKVYDNVRVACVYNRADEATRVMVEDAEVQEGARAIGFGNSIPGPSDIGVVEGILVDRAFLDDRHHAALELATFDDLRHAELDEPQSVQNVLAASALARAAEVPPPAIRAAIRSFRDTRPASG